MKLKKFLKKSVWCLITVFLAVDFIIAMIAGVIAQKYKTQLNGVLGLNPWEIVDNSDSNEDTEYFKSEYYTEDGSYDNQAMRENSLAVSLQAATEGTVLLWNENNALPLAKGSEVNLFGVASGSYLVCEQGSGKIYPTITDTMKGRLEEYGLKVNAKLVNAYRLLKAKGYASDIINIPGTSPVNQGYNEAVINEAPWSELDRTTLGNVTGSLYGDAAIMTISRMSGEDLDPFEFETDKAKGDECIDGNYMDLSKNEADILSHLKELKEQGKIKKIILLINCSNAVQFKNIDDYDIDACLWTGVGGNVSHEQVARVLTGASNPSGHLTDTYVYDNYSAPAVENFGDFTFTALGAGVPSDASYTRNNKYMVYQEGIYVGYRYYETRYADCVYGEGNADGAAGVTAGEGSWNYSDEVAFPFGHGLSYTTFEYSDYSVEKAGDDYKVSMTITNTGSVPGKEVMQVYIQKPYTDYDKKTRIEKAAVELVGFDKTRELAGGESQTLEVTVKGEDFKTYDSYGHKTYILEKGDYYIAAGRNAHDALNNILDAQGKTVADGMDYAGDGDFAHKVTVAADDYDKYSTSATNYKITNQFDNADINLYEGTESQKIKYLSRSDWNGTYPSPVSLECTSEEMVADMQYGKEVEVPEGTEMPAFGKVSEEYGKLSLAMLAGLPYENECWEALLDQLTWEDANCLIASPSEGAESVSAPGMMVLDGPFGMGRVIEGLDSCMCFPCEVNMAATWNTELIEEVGKAFGHEILHLGYTGLYGPGANIHRSAGFSGRNAEYYSEDGFISGKMLAAECSGIQSCGVIVYTKHFLLNDQEDNRYGVTIWANEQSIREIYLKAFEAGVTEGNMNGIMTSFNRIGCLWAGRHPGLLTEVLRNEWGFNGVTLTDAAVPAMFHQNFAHSSAVVAGQDIWMGGADTSFFNEAKDNAAVCQAIREACHRILYSRLNSNCMNGVSTSAQIVYVPTWWENMVLGIQIGLGVLCGISAVITVFAFVYKPRKGKDVDNADNKN